MELTEISIADGRVLSFDYNTVNFDGNFRFGVRENIRISVNKLRCGGTAEEGEIGPQAKALDDLAGSDDYIKLTINGHEFSKPFQLTKFSLDEGPWLQVTSGTLEFQSFHEGNADIGENENYVGWDLTDARFLEDFGDSFTFRREANGISYIHNINLKFAAINPVGGDHITPPLTAGLNLAQGMILNRPEFNWLKEPQLQGLYTDIGLDCKRLLTESVDEINNTVSVTETFNAENIKTEYPCLYSFTATQGIEITEEGIINVSENGTVTNLKLGENNMRADPEECLQAEIVKASEPEGRLEAMFNFHKEQLVGERDCVTSIPDLAKTKSGDIILIEKGITRDLFRGKATYSIRATNDEKIKELATHEYVLTIEALNYDVSDSTCLPFIKASMQGSFIGNDPEGRAFIEKNGQKVWVKYDRAKEVWDDEYEKIKEELKECADTDHYPVVITNTHSLYKGKIAYNLTYSQEPKYGTIATPYKMWTYSYQDDFTANSGDGCVWQHTLQNVANQENQVQVLQQRNTTVLPNSSMNHRMVGKRGKTIKELTNAMIPKVEPRFTGGPKTLKDCSYSFNPENNVIIDANFNWE